MTTSDKEPGTIVPLVLIATLSMNYYISKIW